MEHIPVPEQAPHTRNAGSEKAVMPSPPHQGQNPDPPQAEHVATPSPPQLAQSSVRMSLIGKANAVVKRPKTKRKAISAKRLVDFNHYPDNYLDFYKQKCFATAHLPTTS
jgi:hypothetical protein